MNAIDYRHIRVSLLCTVMHFLSLVDREVYRILCTNKLTVLRLLGIFFFSEEKS